VAKILSEKAIEEVRKTVRTVRQSPWGTPAELTPLGGQPLAMYVGKTGVSGITARSGTTPGSGTVTLYFVNASGTLETWKDGTGTAVTKTCYNLSTSAVGNTAYVMMQRDILSGKLWAVWEDC
jgi:hypothetical protein